MVVLEFSIHDLTALEVREAVDHGCTHLSFAFDYRLDEVHEVPFVGVVELDDHAHVDQIHHDLLFVLPQSLHHIELLLPALHIELLHLLSIELHASYFSLQSEKQFFEVSLNLGEGVVRLLFYLDEDVSSVAVSVDKVIFHVGKDNIRSVKAMTKLGAENLGEEEVAYFGEESKMNVVFQIKKEDWALKQNSI